MKRELKARLARLAQGPGIDRVSSGSPVDLVLRPAGARAKLRTIPAVEALVRRGVALLKAKRAAEALVDSGEAVVHLPTVEDVAALVADLRVAGISGRRLAGVPVDVKAIRVGLSLTQEQFALRYGLDIDAVQNWEQGRCRPDKASTSYLRAIAHRPREVAEAQEVELA